MRQILKTLLLGAFITTFSGNLLQAIEKTYRFQDRNGKNQVRFYSEAPMENIDGEAGRISGSVSFDPQLLTLNGSLSVPVVGMNTGMAMRDEHMRSKDWLDAATYPTIQFALLPLDKSAIRKGKNDSWLVSARGIFSLKGKQKEITTSVKMVLKNKKLTIIGQFSVNLKEFGIKGPAAMNFIGARVGENVQVKLNLVGIPAN